MITIRHAKGKAHGYDIILKPAGPRKVFYAKDLTEVIKAVNHYYIGEVHAREDPHCPLCRKDT